MEASAWAKQMARVQMAMWCDGKTKCAYCGSVYRSVDDFLERNSRAGKKTKDGIDFVDKKCFNKYLEREGIRQKDLS